MGLASLLRTQDEHDNKGHWGTAHIRGAVEDPAFREEATRDLCNHPPRQSACVSVQASERKSARSLCGGGIYQSKSLSLTKNGLEVPTLVHPVLKGNLGLSIDRRIDLYAIFPVGMVSTPASCLGVYECAGVCDRHGGFTQCRVKGHEWRRHVRAAPP